MLVGLPEAQFEAVVELRLGINENEPKGDKPALGLQRR